MTEQVPLSPIEIRRLEVAQYENNIIVYKNILETLPTEWPAHLEQYRGVENQHQAIESVEDLDDVELLSKLWYADQCRKFIRTETVEMTKSKAILAALEAQQIY